MIDILTNTLQA